MIYVSCVLNANYGWLLFVEIGDGWTAQTRLVFGMCVWFFGDFNYESEIESSFLMTLLIVLVEGRRKLKKYGMRV